MKKGYLCSDKIQKRMKSKNIQRLTRFLDHRSSNWQQRLCLIIFLTLCLTVIVAGVPMHIMGIVGRSSGILYAISALMWLMTVVLFVLYMTRRMSLKIAISTFGLLIQLTGSARIVYMAIERLLNVLRVLTRLYCSTRLFRSPSSSILLWLSSDIYQR